MQGKLAHDFDVAWSTVNAIGMSRHEAKQYAKDNLNAKSWHEMGKAIGVYKIETLNTYKTATAGFVNDSGVKNIKELDADKVRDWLESKIDNGVNFKTLDKYCAALEKFSSALEKFTGRHCNWTSTIQDCREIGRNVLGRQDIGARQFVDPQAVTGALASRYEFYGRLQNECGVRISEIKTILVDADGRVWATGKGSFTREIFPSNNLKNEIIDRIKTFGNPGLDSRYEQNAYRDDLKRACEATGERYTGSHAFRSNFAIDNFDRCIDAGMSFQEALRDTSEKLGHHRSDVVEKYYLR